MTMTMTMTEEEAYAFYQSPAWRRKRKAILKYDNYECQLCKTGKGFAHRPMYTPADTVHHVKHLREYPDLKLSDTYNDQDGGAHRQLISVCKRCHEEVCHPERLRHRKTKEPLTIERW